MSILEKLQTMPNVQVVYADAEKIFCSVSVTISRMERINSGSMVFDHPRYYTFGQMVVFTDKDVDDDQCGALFCKAETPEDVQDIIDNIGDYIQAEKEVPDNSIVIKGE